MSKPKLSEKGQREVILGLKTTDPSLPALARTGTIPGTSQREQVTRDRVQGQQTVVRPDDVHEDDRRVAVPEVASNNTVVRRRVALEPDLHEAAERAVSADELESWRPPWFEVLRERLGLPVDQMLGLLRRGR